MDDNWITIKTFTLPTEVIILRGRLEAEGIECFVANELTAQVNMLYSNAIGGVQLQVKESDVEKAIVILKEGGYYTDEETKPSKFLLQLDSITSKIIFLKKLPLFFRLMVLITVIVGTLVSIVVYAIQPTTYEKLIANNWCLDYVVYDNNNFLPQTHGVIKFNGAGFCEESVTFRENGTVILPGFKSNMVWGYWELDNNLLHISRVDTFDFVYNGVYHLDFTNRGLVLKSEKTTLNCHAENVYVNRPF